MTHIITTINFVSASAGGLDGYEYHCSCGDRAAFSFQSMTEDYGRQHAAYMNRQAIKSRRRK